MEKLEDLLSFRYVLIQYLNSIDVIYPSNNRFEQSFREIEYGLKQEALGKRDYSKEAHFRHAAAELQELKFILQNIQSLNLSQDILQEKFKKILSGDRPVNKNENNTNDVSRNILFELMLACYLSFSGLLIKYESGSDISLKFQGRVVGIECKRINGSLISSIKNLLDVGYHQLIKQRHELDCGIIALNIDNVYFKNGQLVFTTDHALIKPNFYKLITTFIDRFGFLWQKRNVVKDFKFVPAVLICLRGTMYASDTNETANVFYAVLNNTSNPPYDDLFLNQLSKVLS